MPHPDEGLIHAWLDGELDAAESARIEALVRSDPEWAAAAAEARGLAAASARIIAALDDVGGTSRPGEATAPAGMAPRRRRPWWMMRAAALLVVVAGTAIVLRRTAPDESRGTTPEDVRRSAPAQQEERSTAPARAKGALDEDRRSGAVEPKAAGQRDQAGALAGGVTAGGAAGGGAAAGGTAVSGAAVGRTTSVSAPVAGAPETRAPVASAPETRAPVASAPETRAPVAGTEGRAALAAATEATLKTAAKDEQLSRLVCYEMVGDEPVSGLDKSARANALAAPRTVARADSLAAAAPAARKGLALVEPANRLRSAEADLAERPAAPVPAALSARLPLQALLRKQGPDTILVTWRDGGEAVTARAVARGDTLIGNASAAGRAPRAFLAVRTACPRP